MAYLGNSPEQNIRRKFQFTATASQTVFTGADDNGHTLKYQDATYVDVYLNGVLLKSGEDYTTSGKTTVTLTSGASLNDILEIIAYGIFSVADTVSASEGGTFFGNVTFTSNVSVTGNLTVGTGTTTITNNSISTTSTEFKELRLSGNTSSIEISANTDNWNPGISNIFQVRVSANTDNNVTYSIGGLEGGVEGKVVVVQNIGLGAVVLKNRDAGSNSENQFSLPDDVRLDGEQSVQMYYDGGSSKWRLLHSVDIPYFHKAHLTKGFFSGGWNGSVNYTTADRTTYSTETTAAVSGANLSQARRAPAAAGNAEKGFFSGGFTTVNVTTADRTTYSTETTAAVSGANLSQARYGMGTAGNAEKGFFSGGETSVSVATADRTTYSTETTAAVSGANLSQARRLSAAAGNAEKGFFSGGETGINLATADRTTYSTETTAAVSGANLSQARNGPGAAGNAEKGFFSGGETSVSVATADRTTYSTETTAAVSGANLSQARFAPGAAGNAEKGFFSGGTTGTNQVTSDRTTYSTETTAAVSGANLSQARNGLAAA